MSIFSESTNLFDRIERVEATICGACARSGRDRGEVEVVAVTKNQPAGVARAVWDAGLRALGENRVREAAEKIPLLPGGVRWHLIGHLQRNKVRVALPLFDLIHSVDSVGLAQAMDRIGGELGLFPQILLQVNVSGEDTKFGFGKDEILREMDSLLDLPRVGVLGLMTMAPYAVDPEKARPHFAALRRMRDRLEARCGVKLPALSMGMSGDYGVAVEEGATLVRIGTALFEGP